MNSVIPGAWSPWLPVQQQGGGSQNGGVDRVERLNIPECIPWIQGSIPTFNNAKTQFKLKWSELMKHITVGLGLCQSSPGKTIDCACVCVYGINKAS